MKKVQELLNKQGENYILPFFWQHGEEADVLRHYIEKIQESGIGAVCVEARPHPEFVKDKWWQDLDLIIEECKQRQMKVWILDDSHFPTGYANGRIKEEFPYLRKKFIKLKQLDYVGPMKNAKAIIKFALTEKEDEVLGVYLAKKISYEQIDEETLIDITTGVDGDILSFDLPAGQWRLLVVVKAFTGGEKQTEGYLNPIDPQATDILIETVYEAHYHQYQHEFGKTIAGFFSDEPRFGNMHGALGSIGRYDMVLPWRDDLLQLLNEKMGGNISTRLPLLFIDGNHLAHEIRYAYMDLVSQLYSEHFAGRLGAWCRQHGVEYIGHVIEDNNAHTRLGYGAGHFFRALKGQDMSGVDVVLHQLLPGQDQGYFKSMTYNGWDGEFFHYALAKLGTSLGHLDPLKKGRTLCEIFGAYGWAEGLKTMKWLADHMLVRGVNYFVPHAFTPKAYPDPDCPPHFYAHGHNPQYKDFDMLITYMNRLSHLISDGKSCPSVGVIYHAEAEWSGDYMLIQKPAKILTQHQIDFEFIPIDYLLEAQIKDQKLIINEYPFKVLVVPYAEALPKSFLNKIDEISKAGIHIYFIDGYPSRTSTGEEMPPLTHCSITTLEDLISDLSLHNIQDITASNFEPYLRTYHYDHHDGAIFMFVNENPYQEINTEIMIDTVQNLYQYDPFENKRLPVTFKQRGFQTSFLLQLSPYESLIIIADQEDPCLQQVKHTTKDIIVLDKDFEVSFATSLEYPNFTDKKLLNQLKDISQLPEKEHFCGTVRYEKEFTLVQPVDQLLIELEEAYESVRVYINNQLIGRKICPPYKLVAKEGFIVGTNKLTIEVSSTLVREQYDYLSQFMLIEPIGILGVVKLHLQDSK